MTDSLATHPQAQLVPAGYAEKAMASLMQLHSELMDEKERRVDLFRRLMEREQALAELKMYVKVLEERLAPRGAPAPLASVPAEPPARQEAAVRPSPAPAPAPTASPVAAQAVAPGPRVAPRAPVAVPPPAVARPRPDGWKTW